MTDELDRELPQSADLDTAADSEHGDTSEPPPAPGNSATNTRQTLAQQIAETEARLARLRAKSRAAETGQKILIGATVLAHARKDPRIRSWLVRIVKQDVVRDVDRKRLDPLITELEQLGLEQRTQ